MNGLFDNAKCHRGIPVYQLSNEVRVQLELYVGVRKTTTISLYIGSAKTYIHRVLSIMAFQRDVVL